MILLSFLFYNFLSYYSDSAKLLELITDFPIEIIKAFFFIITAYIFRYIRWRYIFSHLGEKTSIIKDLLIWFGSFAFAVTPLRTGELSRCFLLKQKCGIDKSFSFAGILFERITDGVSLLLIIFYHIPFYLSWASLVNYNLKFKELFLIILIIMIILLFFQNNIFSTFAKTIHRFKLSFYEKLKILFKKEILFISISLGITAWTFEGISFFILLKGLNASLNIQDAILSQLSSGLLGAISFMPGGIGTTEASSIAILLAQDININIATSATLLGRLISLWLISFIGLICFIYIYSSPNLKNNCLKTSKF